jgi:hypothetical protein
MDAVAAWMIRKNYDADVHESLKSIPLHRSAGRLRADLDAFGDCAVPAL